MYTNDLLFRLLILCTGRNPKVNQTLNPKPYTPGVAMLVVPAGSSKELGSPPNAI